MIPYLRSGRGSGVETLQRLTRRQVDALRAVGLLSEGDAGASLKSVATALRVRSPSALDFLTVLERNGLVARRRGKTRLTARGRSTLAEYQRHHRLAESLFGQLGLSPEDTCAAAREVDLAISHGTVERLCKAEGHPAVCPHGLAIPPCAEERGAHHG